MPFNALNVNVAVPAGKLQVVVRNGWITLDGQAGYWHQKHAAEQTLRYLRGVTGISNNIVVKPDHKTRVSTDDIKRKIESAFQRHAHRDASAIRVTVLDDEVTLEGDVPSWDERQAAELAAWAAPGVTQVNDRLVIRA